MWIQRIAASVDKLRLGMQRIKMWTRHVFSTFLQRSIWSAYFTNKDENLRFSSSIPDCSPYRGFFYTVDGGGARWQRGRWGNVILTGKGLFLQLSLPKWIFHLCFIRVRNLIKTHWNMKRWLNLNVTLKGTYSPWGTLKAVNYFRALSEFGTPPEWNLNKGEVEKCLSGKSGLVLAFLLC